VLLPVLEAQEILPRELALSKGRRPFKEGDVHEDDALRARRLCDLLGHHLPHKRDGDSPEAVQHLIGAADAGAREEGSLGRDTHLVWIVLARLGDELLETQGDVVGHPGLESRLGLLGAKGRAIELFAHRLDERLHAGQPRLQGS
jgi:hypothetical protein